MNGKYIVRIREPEDVQVVRDSGCELLAAYPDSLLVRCTESQVEALQNAGIEAAAIEDPTLSVSGASFTMSDVSEAEAAVPVDLDPNRTAYYLVQLVGPAKGEWLDYISTLGGVIHGKLSRFTLLVGILPSRVPELLAQSWVESVTPYRPAMKVSQRLRPGVGREYSASDLASIAPDNGDSATAEQVEISFFPGEGTAATAAQIREAEGLVLAESENKITAVMPANVIPEIAQRQEVQAIIPHRFPEFNNDVAASIMHTPASHVFADLDLRGNDQIVAVADSGLDIGDAAAIHDDFTGRIVDIVSQPNAYPFLCNDPAPFDDGAADTDSGHGTHVAGSVLADGAAAAAAGSAINPQGMAPGARLYFQAIEQEVDWKTAAQLIIDGIAVPPVWPWPARGLYGLPENLNDLFTAAYSAGARIHTNSWSAPNAGLYNTSARQVDEFMWNNRDQLILFSAGNYGEDDNDNGVIDDDSIGTPATAKNCVTVGATENVRPHDSNPPPGLDAEWDQLTRGGGVLLFPELDAAGHISDQANGMAAFSSRGPTDDGRIKPDIVAPGTNVLSVRSAAVAHANPLWGDLPAGHELHGLYCWSGGTSMSTPLVAGASALIRQYLIQHRGHYQDGVKPSGALIKAFLINGAEGIAPGQFEEDPVGTPPIPAADEIPDEPNNVDGFGRADLTETLIPGELKLALFADEPDYAVESGETRTFEVQAVDLGQPMRITLVWTDAPGPVNIGGIENELYLRVRDPGGAMADGDVTAYPTVKNNVQRVVIDAPVAGTYEIEVCGVNVFQQAPGASPGPNPRQDFALVVSNGMGFSLQPVSVAQAIDTTGSMGTFGYMEPAKERAGQLLDFMRINDRVSITEFSKRPAVLADARTAYDLRLLGSFDPDWEEAHTAINGLFDDGRTPIGAGLRQANFELAAAPGSQPRAIVLLSDGQNNEDPHPDVVLPEIADDIPIFTIALGPACSEATLRNIAESRPNGGYYAVESDEDVHKLHEIYAQVQALAAGDALVGFSSAYSESGSESGHTMPVEPGAKEATFALSWETKRGLEKMKLLVIGPDGKQYDASTAATLEREGESHHLLRIAAPRPGIWELIVKNYGSSEPAKYTVSGAVYSRLTLQAETPKVGDRFLILTAKLRYGEKPWDDAHVMARVTMPTHSLEAILEKYGDEIKKVDLTDDVFEEGLSEEQIQKLKVAVFARKYCNREGGLFGRETVEFEMIPHGDGEWLAEIPISAPGNARIEVLAEGDKDGIPWTRHALQSTLIPERAVRPRKVIIEEIPFRRNSLWDYVIIGARVLHTDGKPATPRDRVTVNMILTQRLHKVKSGDLPYYSPANYFIWRCNTRGFASGAATVTVQAKLNGLVVDTERKVIHL